MKKTILSIALFAAFATVSFAQEVTPSAGGEVVNKKGEAILPKAGDIAIGISALPFLNYAGNMFNQAGLNTLSLNDATIYGRYYISDNAAIRFDLNVNNTTDVTKTLVPDVVALVADPNSLKTVEDKLVTKNRDITIGAGYQMYRGYGRLRGYYGGLISYRYQKAGITENTWGNALTATNDNGGASRSLSNEPSATNTIKLGPVAGIEYYFAPKICIGVDINLLWGVRMANSYTEATTEVWDLTLATPAYVKTTTKAEEAAGDAKSYNRTLTTTGAVAGSIYLMFNF